MPEPPLQSAGQTAVLLKPDKIAWQTQCVERSQFVPKPRSSNIKWHVVWWSCNSRESVRSRRSGTSWHSSERYAGAKPTWEQAATVVVTNITVRFDCKSTALRPFDELRYAVLRLINKQITVTVASALRHSDLKGRVERIFSLHHLNCLYLMNTKWHLL